MANGTMSSHVQGVWYEISPLHGHQVPFAMGFQLVHITINSLFHRACTTMAVPHLFFSLHRTPTAT